MAEKKAVVVTEEAPAAEEKPKAPRSTAKPQANAADPKLLDRTVKGVKFKIDPAAFDDLELFDMLGELEEGDMLMVSKVLRRALGPEQFSNVLEQLRDKKTARVPITRATEFLMALLTETDPNG